MFTGYPSYYTFIMVLLLYRKVFVSILNVHICICIYRDFSLQWYFGWEICQWLVFGMRTALHIVAVVAVVVVVIRNANTMMMIVLWT